MSNAKDGVKMDNGANSASRADINIRSHIQFHVPVLEHGASPNASNHRTRAHEYRILLVVVIKRKKRLDMRDRKRAKSNLVVILFNEDAAVCIPTFPARAGYPRPCLQPVVLSKTSEI
jgi:hypothetical protein